MMEAERPPPPPFVAVAAAVQKVRLAEGLCELARQPHCQPG
jgi:hypothetical protein